VKIGAGLRDQDIRAHVPIILHKASTILELDIILLEAGDPLLWELAYDYASLPSVPH
jgi:hypothetical protein